jgi:hypothetical protein
VVKHCGSVPSVAARRHDGDQFVEVEVNDHLQCLGSWALAQGYGETVSQADIRLASASPIEPKVPRHRRARGATALPSRLRVLAPASAARHIREPMAGSPLKRQRKQGIRLDDGRIIAFPYMPRVADLPSGWRHFSAAEKIEHLLGMTLDDMDEILSWPIAELDPFRLSVRLQVMRIIFAIGVKALLDGKLDRDAARERDRDRVLEKLSLGLHARLRDGAAPGT